jgi:hypothetical protein
MMTNTSLSSGRRDEAKKLLADGKDPSDQRKLDKLTAKTMACNTFGAIVEDYLMKLAEEGAAPATIQKNRWLLEDLASSLHARLITAITPAEILLLLQRIEKTGRRETAHRLRGVIGSVFRLAVATLRTTNDPTYALRGALLKKTVKHRAAIIDERELGALMRSIPGGNSGRCDVLGGCALCSKGQACGQRNHPLPHHACRQGKT